MKKRAGPLPAWGWLVVVLAGVGLALWIRSRGSGTAPAAQTPVSDGGSVGPSVAPAPSGLDPAIEQLLLMLQAQGKIAAGPVDTGTGSAPAGGSGGGGCATDTDCGDTGAYRCHKGTCKPRKHEGGGQSPGHSTALWGAPTA